MWFKKRLLFGLCWCLALMASANQLPVASPEDAAKVAEILRQLRESDKETGGKLVLAAKALEGAQLDDYYRRDSIAALRVNLDSVTPLMFVNNVVALVKASERPGMADISTFSQELADIATRRGENKGFPSIMYHSSDWIGDNISRGNVTELTENYPGMIPRTKSLDELTRHRDRYAVLADSATFETVRMTEMGFRTHRVPTLKKEIIKKKDLTADIRDGDILILVPGGDGVDYYDMGFISMEPDGPHLVHLSPISKTVVEEKDVLSRYFDLMTKHFQGFRLLRLKE